MSESPKSYKAPTGMPDILPEDMPAWLRLENAVRRLFPLYGYREIRTPLCEETQLFSRSVGEATDIVEKQMYTFSGGENEKSLTLRPEMTASVVRALIEHQLFKQKTMQKFFYIGPMFRKERPQKGRFRQFYQLGIEAFGSQDPLIDAETVMLFQHLLMDLGLSRFGIRLNSIGCMTCRGSYRDTLKQAMQSRLKTFCPDCKRRYERNPFRVLDCKVETCVQARVDLPRITDHLCAACRDHFDSVRKALDQNSVPYQVDPFLVRGLDYYTRTVYEVTSDLLGSQDSLGGGGRYDALVRELDGPDMGAVGFAAGMERLIMVMQQQEGSSVQSGSASDFYIVTIGAEQRPEAFRMLAELRRAGLSGDLDYEGRSVKAQMREGTRSGARFAVILGSDEVSRKVVKVKNMIDGVEVEVARDKMVETIKERR